MLNVHPRRCLFWSVIYMFGLLLNVLKFLAPIGENRRPRELQPAYDVPRVRVSSPWWLVLTRRTTIVVPEVSWRFGCVKGVMIRQWGIILR